MEGIIVGLRKVCNQYRPYSNCVTLRGQLSNWTSEDIVEVATKNIETIIEPIRGELAEQTIWDEIGQAGENGGTTVPDGMVEFGSIGDSLKDENEYQWETMKEEESYEWRKL